MKRDDACADRPHCQDGGDEVAALAHAIAAELGVALGSAERVAADCARLRQVLHDPPTESEGRHLVELAGLLARCPGTPARPLAALLQTLAADYRDPWSLLQGVIAATQGDLVQSGLECAARLASAGGLEVGEQVVRFLADRVEEEGSRLREPEALRLIARMLGAARGPSTERAGPALELFLGSDATPRRLAARILDLDGEPVARELRERLLGQDAHAQLGDYLDYTRASHLDLAHLLARPPGAQRVASALAEAERQCGKALLRELVAELGWPRVNLGLEIRPLVGVSLGGSFPFMVTPAEAELLASSGDVRRTGEQFLVIAHGGTCTAEGDAIERDPVERFRAHGAAHAELLPAFLDVTLPTRTAVRRLLDRMDRLVAEFATLFASHTDECPAIADVYRDLRERVMRELEREGGEDQLSPVLTRLVWTFEDPQSPGDVRTLHGLKRYLHQRSLRLAFRLVQAGRGTNRTVDVLVASQTRVLRRLRTLHYVDFDPGAGETPSTVRLPFPVCVIAEGFSRSLLHGRESFPKVQIFCYGSEIHYYVSFGNHPALLRVNYAPPLQGGMIDLEFFGVSKYELSGHPNPALDGLAQLFRRLDFDVRIENTHVSARYDKERSIDLGDLCEKAESLACALPYLMDLDWVLGDVARDAEARVEVARAWADWLARWGVLPLEQILTRDRCGILAGVEKSPAGEREIPWPGEGVYRDRFSATLPLGLPETLREALRELGLDSIPLLDDATDRPLGQLRLERELLGPLRAALSRGEIAVSPRGPLRRAGENYQSQHEAEHFAEILAMGDERLRGCAAVAHVLGPLERMLRFRTTGAVEGYEVQSASLPLTGASLRVSVLRDSAGIIRLGLFTDGPALGRRRAQASDAWRSNARVGGADLGMMLRRSGYVTPGAESALEVTAEESARIRDTFRGPNPTPPVRPHADERVVMGLGASPGRVVGRALFGTAGRVPGDFKGAILVTASLRPDDNAFIYRAAGAVSTGGGVLSHVGLTAMEFHKPALIVPGEWEHVVGGPSILRVRGLEYREEARDVAGFHVSVRRNLREPEHRLHEGDLVVLDADAGTLGMLGQDGAALGLHEELRALAEALRCLAAASDPAEILTLRGRKLRARHQLVKLLARLTSRALARHAVRELLVGGGFAAEPNARGERIRLLAPLLDNPQVGRVAQECLLDTVRELARRLRTACARAEQQIPVLPSIHEVLAARLEILRQHDVLADTEAALKEAGLQVPGFRAPDVRIAERLARRRLRELRERTARALAVALAPDERVGGRRHVLRHLERLDDVLATPERVRKDARRARADLERSDEAARARLAGRQVLWPSDGGMELDPLVGSKAANLAEIERLERTSCVPPWFVVTQHAFAEVMRLPVERPDAEAASGGPESLQRAIERVLTRADLGHAEKSSRIRALWEKFTLPEVLSETVKASYRRLATVGGAGSGPVDEAGGPFVSVRSSAREEDLEIAARAGEFDTFLFVRGEEQVLEHLKRAWSGLWTERAIHNRAVLGLGAEGSGGGVIVQRMVCSRVSGVLITSNVAEGELLEMVVNAGLGLGEGVVSGAVAADHVVVAKGSDLAEKPLRFRYVTADKRERVSFDQRAGAGTVRAETLYHQRLRPALEYLELAELVRLAARLEAAYGYPLNLEFGIEGARLWLLQVRPVPFIMSAVQDTLEHHPLTGAVAEPAA